MLPVLPPQLFQMPGNNHLVKAKDGKHIARYHDDCHRNRRMITGDTDNRHHHASQYQGEAPNKDASASREFTAAGESQR